MAPIAPAPGFSLGAVVSVGTAALGAAVVVPVLPAVPVTLYVDWAGGPVRAAAASRGVVAPGVVLLVGLVVAVGAAVGEPDELGDDPPRVPNENIFPKNEAALRTASARPAAYEKLVRNGPP
jgi:hypothetical protein